jgi:hypothetical protein
MLTDINTVASDESSYMTVRLLTEVTPKVTNFRQLQGTDLKVDGGLTSAYVTPIGEPALPPPSSLVG